MPDAIYELLPYFYIGSGTAAALGLEVSYGQFFGILLLLAGVVILKMRIQSRRGIRG